MNSSLENLTEVFAKMRVGNFDTDSQLKWGFYFIDADKKKLNLVYTELQGSGYVLEKIYRLKGVKKWTLFTSKIDTLTPEKLYRRNLAFNELAEYCGVELYDGWDVEKIPSL